MVVSHEPTGGLTLENSIMYNLKSSFYLSNHIPSICTHLFCKHMESYTLTLLPLPPHFGHMYKKQTSLLIYIPESQPPSIPAKEERRSVIYLAY
jgi:hypothetical protein